MIDLHGKNRRNVWMLGIGKVKNSFKSHKFTLKKINQSLASDLQP